jgi:predicted RNase H-like HicB family nuclease
MKAYTVIVHEGEPDEGGYWAEVEELPGCFASGDTLDELEVDIKDAIETYVSALQARGEPVPEGRGSVEDDATRRWQIHVAVA